MRYLKEIASLKSELANLHVSEDDYSDDPASLMEAAGLAPDPWQRKVLTSKAKQSLLLITRQGGKSTTTAAKALHKAMYKPGAEILLFAPALRQSQELFSKVTTIYQDAGAPVPIEMLSALRMTLVNGSRIIALPGNEKTVRGYSGVDLVVIDEASRVPDELYFSVRPMLAVSGGELMALTTPFGKRGWFYEEWTGSNEWERTRITANDCPRISKEFLEEERASMPDIYFKQEYMCEFCETAMQFFGFDEIHGAYDDTVEPFFSGNQDSILVHDTSIKSWDA